MVAFPGQGVAQPAVRVTLRRHDRHPLVRRLAGIVGDDWEQLDLLDTRNSQPCTFVAGLVAAQAVDIDRVPITMGHSLGEITALAFAGVVSSEAGLELVRRRGEACQAVQSRHPGAMAAVMGLEPMVVEWLRRRAGARSGGVLDVAAVNGPRQIILSGHRQAVDEVVRLVGEHQGLAQVLPIGGAFHCGLMDDALAPFGDAVAQVTLSDPLVSVLSTVDCQVHLRGEDFRPLLVQALVLPVRWHEALCVVRERGIERGWDAGPGETLAKLGRRTKLVQFVDHPTAKVEREGAGLA
jgi:[acyl-carrier-protein] S-malonyltransferase